jgi:hypothetical protein
MKKSRLIERIKTIVKGNCFDEIKAHIPGFCDAVRKRQSMFV